MTSQLRAVLNRFADQSAPISVNRLAQEMNIERGVLGDMIDYWVRKGKLREVNSGGQACNTCGVKGACPFIIALPRYYELVHEADAAHDDTPPPCACGSGHCKT